MLTDRDNNPIVGTMLRVTNFNPNEQQALNAYPGGLDVMAEVGGLMINGATQTAGTEAQVSFKSAGFAAITITDDAGNKVRNFSQPIEVAMQFPIGTTDENNQSISVGDTVPIWSYDEDTGQWIYESEGIVTDQDGADGLYDVSYSVTHLSYYNLDWFVPPEIDTDGDGIPNRLDDDIDGDGIPNDQDDDDDGDGITDNNDDDSNGDGSADSDDDNRVYNCTSVFELEDGLGNRDYDPYNFELSIPSANINRTYDFNRGAFIAFPFVRSVSGSLTITTKTDNSIIAAINVNNFCEPAIRQVTTRLARKNINIGADRNINTDAGSTIAAQTVTDNECGRTLTYTASNPSVATTDTDTAVISVVGAGVTTITANATQNDRCAVASDSYQLSVNLNPVAISSVTAMVNEDDSSTFSIVLSASDTTGDVLTWTLVIPANNGTATVSGTGVSPNIIYLPVEHFDGTDSFVIRVSDDNGASATIVVNVVIVAVNDAPTFTSSPVITATEDRAYSYTATATDMEGDGLSFSLVTSPSPSWLSLSGATLSGTPTNDDVGTHSITIRVSDNTVNTEQSFIITVVNSNDAPIINQGVSINVLMSEDSSPTAFVAPTITATDEDLDDSLTWSLASDDSNGVVTASGTGASPIITYTPNANYNGTDSFVVQVRDVAGSTDTIVVNVTITAVDDVPTLERTTILIASVDNTYTLTITAQDIDGDALSFSIQNQPSWTSFNTATATATLTGTPSSSDVGEFSSITIGVTANGVTTNLEPFSITVDAQPPTPAIWNQFDWNDGSTWQ